jgi:hypothetical protein
LIETPCPEGSFIIGVKTETCSRIDRVGPEDAADHPAIETDWPSKAATFKVYFFTSLEQRWNRRLDLSFPGGASTSRRWAFWGR